VQVTGWAIEQLAGEVGDGYRASNSVGDYAIGCGSRRWV
jgi:hypothetical protein